MKASKAAARMRRARLRRARRLRYIGLDLRESEVAALVARNLLTPADAEDGRAIRDALYAFLESALR